VDVVNILTFVVVALYMGGAIAVFSRLFHPEGPNPKVYLSFGSLAILSHSVLLSNNIFFQHTIDLSLINVISLVAFIITFSVTFIAIRFKANLIVTVTYGFAALLLSSLAFVPENQHMTIDVNKANLVTHISLALLSYAILVIATLYALQVKYINHKLKSKNISAINNFPPLMQVEGQLFKIMLAGTICLLISQVVGLLFIDGFFGSENLHKTILSFIALVIYVLILLGHYRLGWRGHRVLILSLVATTLLTLSYFGSRFVKEFLLS
jgi:ABC-type uncharacterized transport system permease subunit